MHLTRYLNVYHEYILVLLNSPSHRSTVWNMSVLTTPYRSAALRNCEICSICLKAMLELWIFFTGLSLHRLLMSSHKTWARYRERDYFPETSSLWMTWLHQEYFYFILQLSLVPHEMWVRWSVGLLQLHIQQLYNTWIFLCEIFLL